LAARRVNRNAVPSPAFARVSAIATAARFSDGAAPPGCTRRKRAQSSAIFRRVVSSNDLTIPLDYNTRATDEMTPTA
jgi:hypothetical protein